jgi:hypothetical protein
MPVLARTAHTIEDGRFASLRSLAHHRAPRRSQIDIAMKTSPIDRFLYLLACNLPFLQPAVAQAVAAATTFGALSLSTSWICCKSYRHQNDCMRAHLGVSHDKYVACVRLSSFREMLNFGLSEAALLGLLQGRIRAVGTSLAHKHQAVLQPTTWKPRRLMCALGLSSSSPG